MGTYLLEGSAPAQYLAVSAARFAYYGGGGFEEQGPLTRDGHRLVFGASNKCPGTGTYTWDAFSPNEVTFTPVGTDPCPRAGFMITANRWRQFSRSTSPLPS